jgi:hypothetical protein
LVDRIVPDCRRTFDPTLFIVAIGIEAEPSPRPYERSARIEAEHALERSERVTLFAGRVVDPGPGFAIREIDKDSPRSPSSPPTRQQPLCSRPSAAGRES